MGKISEFRPLNDKKRKFVHLLAYSGLDKLEAYTLSHGINLDECDIGKLRTKSNKLFYAPVVNNYYHAIMEEIRENEIKKGVWTKEIATTKLMNLVEKAEAELEDPSSKVTMSRLNAIVLPIKELNTIHGYNNTSNVNIDGCIVQICGEDNIED